MHIRLKESLDNRLMVRLQGGSFGAFRSFVGYSPQLDKADAFLAYEGSHTDGPFLNSGRYNRNNVTGNYTRHLSDEESLGFKLNFGTNDFYSSGQIPLDRVAGGQLDRFGFIDPFDGGRVRLGTLGAYYKRDLDNGDILKLDGFLARARSLIFIRTSRSSSPTRSTATKFSSTIRACNRVLTHNTSILTNCSVTRRC